MTQRKIRATSFVYSLTVAACLLPSAAVQAQTTQGGINVSAESGATRNPYQSGNDDRTVGVAKVELRPWFRLETARETLEIDAYARGRAFSDIYDFEDSEGASVSLRSQQSAQVSIYGSASIASNSALPVFPGSYEAARVTDPVDIADAGTPVGGPTIIAPEDDITLLGLTGRTTSIDTEAGLDYQVDARSYVGISTGYQRLSAENDALTSYNTYSADARYLRQVSPRSRIGASVGARRIDFDGGGQSRIYYTEVTLEQELDAFWSLEASVGVSTTDRSAIPGFAADTSTGLTGSIDLCNRQPGRDICLNYRRAQTPGALGRVQTVDSSGFRYSERTSARGRVDVYAGYSRSSSIVAADGENAVVEVASVQTNFTHTLNNRMDAYVFASVGRLYGSAVPSEPSVSFGIGLRVSLGRR